MTLYFFSPLSVQSQLLIQLQLVLSLLATVLAQDCGQDGEECSNTGRKHVESSTDALRLQRQRKKKESVFFIVFILELLRYSALGDPLSLLTLAVSLNLCVLGHFASLGISLEGNLFQAGFFASSHWRDPTSLACCRCCVQSARLLALQLSHKHETSLSSFHIHASGGRDQVYFSSLY